MRSLEETLLASDSYQLQVFVAFGGLTPTGKALNMFKLFNVSTPPPSPKSDREGEQNREGFISDTNVCVCVCVCV